MLSNVVKGLAFLFSGSSYHANHGVEMATWSARLCDHSTLRLGYAVIPADLVVPFRAVRARSGYFSAYFSLGR